MREIKFRTWDKLNKKWVTNNNCESETKLNYDSRHLVVWNNYKLMQYTGYKDWFESDLIKDKDRNALYEIVWHEKNFAWWGESLTEGYFSKPLYDIIHDVNACKFGNKYDNPELLGVENETI